MQRNALLLGFGRPPMLCCGQMAPDGVTPAGLFRPDSSVPRPLAAVNCTLHHTDRMFAASACREPRRLPRRRRRPMPASWPCAAQQRLTGQKAPLLATVTFCRFGYKHRTALVVRQRQRHRRRRPFAAQPYHTVPSGNFIQMHSGQGSGCERVHGFLECSQGDAQGAGWRAAAGMKRCAGRLSLEGEPTACCSTPAAASITQQGWAAASGACSAGARPRPAASCRLCRSTTATTERMTRRGGRGRAWRCSGGGGGAGAAPPAALGWHLPFYPPHAWLSMVRHPFASSLPP